jgi:hypothetical protein
MLSIECRPCGSRCRRSYGRPRDEIQRRLDALGEIEGLAVTVHVHEEDAGLIPEEMIVKRGNLQTAFQQG